MYVSRYQSSTVPRCGGRSRPGHTVLAPSSTMRKQLRSRTCHVPSFRASRRAITLMPLSWILAATGPLAACPLAEASPWDSARLAWPQLTPQKRQFFRRMDPELAPLFTGALYQAVKATQIMSEAQFQAANFKLRDREYKYYLAAHKELDAIPDLSDMSGGLSNPAYFNFVYYIAWKVACTKLSTPELQAAFSEQFGMALLDALSPGARERLASAAAHSGSVASVGEVQQEIERILQDLQRRGYAQKCQVVWGESSQDVPFGWETDSSAGLRQVADADRPLACFQVRMRLPADIEGSVSLRSEQDGFWSRSISSMLMQLLNSAGYEAAVDELFIQDQWNGPSSLKDKVLLFFGDPLMEVDVPWVPQSLIQNWSVAV